MQATTRPHSIYLLRMFYVGERSAARLLQLSARGVIARSRWFGRLMRTWSSKSPRRTLKSICRLPFVICQLYLICPFTVLGANDDNPFSNTRTNLPDGRFVEEAQLLHTWHSPAVAH